ncbi:MAG TPA: DUF4097 family beta strand repeat-containing protein [Candidatus Dormibacteraeota bacterium]|jgi:hypothetical protein|nr:DUF4097 family beta strand repeat-containing protein [Candidatus Dormibacteraeota bacterium]
MLRKSLFASVFFALLIAVTAVPGLAISKDFDQTYPLQPNGSFELQNVNGPVEVQGWDLDAVEVHAVKTAKHRDSDLDRVTIEVAAKLDAISVSTRYPQDEGVEVAVEYVIHVPYGAHIDHIGTINGSLRIAGLPFVDDLHTVNGNIEVFDGGGDLHAHTTNGNIHLELAHFHGGSGASAETTNGSLLVALPSDTQADLETRCLNGNFLSEMPIAMESTLKPREMHGRYGKGGAPIKLRTINGGIRIVTLQATV